jgi:hypothetical protein
MLFSQTLGPKPPGRPVISRELSRSGEAATVPARRQSCQYHSDPARSYSQPRVGSRPSYAPAPLRRTTLGKPFGGAGA